MYYHVIENVQRNGLPHYKLVKTYKNWKAMDAWLRKDGIPRWIIGSKLDHVPVRSSEGFGGFTAQYYNTGGYGITTMPKLPLAAK